MELIMNFLEQLAYARKQNKKQASRAATTTTKPVKPTITDEEYRTYIVSLALIKLKQKKEKI